MSTKSAYKRLQALSGRLEAARARAWARMTDEHLEAIATWPEKAPYTGEALEAVKAYNRLLSEELKHEPT
jgi:hypothetical protein